MAPEAADPPGPWQLANSIRARRGRYTLDLRITVTHVSDSTAAFNYSSYLALGEILGAQRPRSDEHDETLFIVIHQIYELWFEQLIHETRHAQGELQPATDRKRCTRCAGCARS